MIIAALFDDVSEHRAQATREKECREYLDSSVVLNRSRTLLLTNPLEDTAMGTLRTPMGTDRWQPGWRKERSDDGTFSNIFDANDRLVEVEHYHPTGESCGRVDLVNVRIETPDGELIGQHLSHPISSSSYDIHVTDAEGTLRLILHHSDVDRGEPYTIREEWIDR
jgi:hypothetical protein